MKLKNKKILFYCSTAPQVIIYKLARLLKKKGYETGLFSMAEEDRINRKFYSEAFGKIICSNFQFYKPNIKNFLYFLKRFPGLVKFLVYMKLSNPGLVISNGGNNWQLKLIHKYFFRKYPFIYFPYDILSHYFSNEEEALRYGTRKFEIIAEKYCFENAEGVIHKGAEEELEFIKGRIHKKINLPKLQLNFLPYCSKEFSVPLNKNKLSKKDEELHFVYLGSFPNNQDYFKSLMDIFQKILNQKIHIHIYMFVDHIPKKREKKFIGGYFIPSIAKNKYFHLHKPLNPKKIILEASKYDFGFLEAWEIDNPGDISSRFTTGNKLASYLEAGLPVIYEERVFMTDKLMKLYGAGIPFNKENITKIRKKIEKKDYKELEKNVVKAREDFDIDKNFPRLEKFIKEVIGEKNVLNLNNLFKSET